MFIKCDYHWYVDAVLGVAGSNVRSDDLYKDETRCPGHAPQLAGMSVLKCSLLIFYLQVRGYWRPGLTLTRWERDVGLPAWYERSLIVRWVVGSILHGGPTKLFLVPACVLRLV